MRIPRKLRFFQASRFSEEAGAARSPRAVPIARRPGSALALPGSALALPGSARASRRRLLRLSLAALSAMPLLSACGSGGGAKPGPPSSDVASRGPAGAKTPGDRRAIAGSQARALRALRLPVPADVTVSVEPTVGSTSVTFKCKLTNDSAQTVWAVHSPAVSVMPDSGRKTGVVAAMAFFPVRKGVSCV